MDRISKARTKLISRLPFFGHLLAYATITVVDGPGTACVSQNANIKFFKEYMDKLSDAELAWVLSHEILHVAMRCWDRAKGRNALAISGSGQTFSMWNVAHDYAINLILEDFIPYSRGTLARPPNVCYDTRFTNMSAEEIYDILMKETPNFDDYDPDMIGDGNSPEAIWRERLKQAIAKQRGQNFCPTSLAAMLGPDPCQINWVEELAHWVGSKRQDPFRTYTRMPRRQIEADVLVPGKSVIRVPQIVFLWDTSGSMVELIPTVFKELEGICLAAKAPLRVILCDTGVCGDFEDVREAQELAEKIKGGGGSDFNPAFASVEDPESLIIAFTDGYISVPPGHACQTMWVLTHDGVDPTNGTWGSVLRMPAAK